jgi:hypothetical protein
MLTKLKEKKFGFSNKVFKRSFHNQAAFRRVEKLHKVKTYKKEVMGWGKTKLFGHLIKTHAFLQRKRGHIQSIQHSNVVLQHSY